MILLVLIQDLKLNLIFLFNQISLLYCLLLLIIYLAWIFLIFLFPFYFQFIYVSLINLYNPYLMGLVIVHDEFLLILIYFLLDEIIIFLVILIVILVFSILTIYLENPLLFLLKVML